MRKVGGVDRRGVRWCGRVVREGDRCAQEGGGRAIEGLEEGLKKLRVEWHERIG